ncbi:HNH endonuclease [Brucella anthropi]|uniref:HNH endonuclease n=1 Tax=Brucella anthropi TaxID=529 RepID=UPI00124C3167|nr:hypothetical protein F9K76_01965 [Brucella anthropi]KAB2745412.1 hypothetical protein F9K74_01915 [Brucella anthropi]KAB2805836.1 hypothetical protein F9K83_01915 [Brucella anthropi]
MSCSVNGCDRAILCKGYCVRHYQRFKRHGHPLAGAASHSPKGDGLKLIELALRAAPQHCFLWPYSNNGIGYGKVSIEGRSVFVHRYVCELQHGPAPSVTHHAAHSCGNGHLGCINPHHLRWATPKENIADQKLHGTAIRGERVGSAKLNEETVRLVRRRLARGEMQKHIAADLGVNQSTVSYIKSGRIWSWLK